MAKTQNTVEGCVVRPIDIYTLAHVLSNQLYNRLNILHCHDFTWVLFGHHPIGEQQEQSSKPYNTIQNTIKN